MDKFEYLADIYNYVCEDYQNNINNSSYYWDYVIITASNKRQALIYEKQLELRKEYLPKYTKYLVIPDDDGLRIGSAGATLSVIGKIYELEGNLDKKVLLIHSGGQSVRIPQYSLTGKLFSPIPHVLNDERASTLFDEMMILFNNVPKQIKSGMLILSGDVFLLFDPSTLRFDGSDAIAISFKENVHIGQNHGVYVEDDGVVSKFLHKQSIEHLTDCGAVDENGMVNIDTGAIYFNTTILNDLLSLMCSGNKIDQEKYKAIVNDRYRLSLYGDLLYPMATSSSLESFYLESCENKNPEELKEIRKVLYETLHKYRINLLKLYPTKFFHLGTSKDYINFYNDIEQYNLLNWHRSVNSAVRSGNAYKTIMDFHNDSSYDSYIEASFIDRNVSIGKNSIISHLHIKENTIIPDDVVMYGLRTTDGKYVCYIYGINDNPNENILFSKPIDEKLWNYRLYPECETIEKAVICALDIYEGNISDCKKTDKHSLSEIAKIGDYNYIFDLENKLDEMLPVYELDYIVNNNVPLKDTKLRNNILNDRQIDVLNRLIEKESLLSKMRLCYYYGRLTNNRDYEDKAFRYLSDTLTKNIEPDKIENIKADNDEVIVSLPLRINFAGGWSDTPPYYIEYGGNVLNAAIILDDDNPVKVTIRKLEDRKIILESKDLNTIKEIKDISELYDFSNPLDALNLQKVAMLVTGLLTGRDNLEALLDELGFGIQIICEVINVPEGSGLGTSSILLAACVKAISMFFDLPLNDEGIIKKVLAAEQIMTTGGGWQDQIGGICNGIKFIHSTPGINSRISYEKIDVSERTLDELNKRLVLIYTGQRRLARNILRNVVGSYLANDVNVLNALSEIQQLAKKMKNALLADDIDEFASLLSQHWMQSKIIDKGSSNSLIEDIFDAVDDLISGRMICGAGGGGFLQVILKDNYTKEDLQNRLDKIFPDSNIKVYNSRII